MKLETLAELNTERAARRPAIVVLDPANGEQRLVKAKDIAADPLRTELSKQLRMGTSGMVEVDGKKLFLNVYAPTARLVITSSASVTTAPSTQPPDTEPRNVPSSLITRLEPAGRGAEPQVWTTVASATP